MEVGDHAKNEDVEANPSENSQPRVVDRIPPFRPEQFDNMMPSQSVSDMSIGMEWHVGLGLRRTSKVCTALARDRQS
jgi:hypothetical protein